MELNFEIYKGKNFSSLCKDIVKNSENKKDQIDILISELRSLIKTVNDATIIVPMIKDYYDVGVKNDEQLVKLAAVIQRLVAKGESSGEGSAMVLSEEERKQALNKLKYESNLRKRREKETPEQTMKKYASKQKAKPITPELVPTF